MIAERLSIGTSHLSLLEAGKRQPSVQALEEVSTALNVPPHLLTLLASEPSDIENPVNADEIARLAQALLRVLVSGDNQPLLPVETEIECVRDRAAQHATVALLQNPSPY